MRHLKISKQITNRDEGSINRYFQEIKKYPLISTDEEIELSARIRNGDAIALEKLVVANLRFVVSVAKQYQNQGLSFSDLINEGNMGLMRAASRFDETRGFKFISYAVWWIRQAIVQALSEQTRIVRLPLNRLSSINKISQAIPYLEQSLEREPTDDELANYLEMNKEEVTIANEIKKRQFSFDSPLKNDGESDFSLYDVVQTDFIPSPDSEIMLNSTTININRILNKLNQRESSILKMAFGLDGTSCISLHDIAEKMNLTPERVRQIKSKGILKIKQLLGDNYAFIE